MKRTILSARMLSIAFAAVMLASCDLEEIGDDSNPENQEQTNDNKDNNENKENTENNENSDNKENTDNTNKEPGDNPGSETRHTYSSDQKIKAWELMWPEDDLIRANTARDAEYLSDICKQAIYFSNLARINGKLFAETFLEYYNPDKTSDDYISLVENLTDGTERKPINPDELLSKAAQTHASDKDKNSHTSGDGTSATDRVMKVFGCSYYAGESISWERISNGLVPICQLLIDKGHGPGYGHRAGILNPKNLFAGIGLSTENDGWDVMVIDYGYLRPADKWGILCNNFTEEMRNQADVARDVSYLSDDEKDFFMIANLCRMDFQKVIEAYSEMGRDVAELEKIAKDREGAKYGILYPDKEICKARVDGGKGNNYTPLGPDITDGNAYSQTWNKYVYTIDKCDAIWYFTGYFMDPQFNSAGIKQFVNDKGEYATFGSFATRESSM